MGHFPNCWEKFIAQKDDVPAAVYIFTHQYVHILQFEEHCRQEMDMEGQGRGNPSMLCLTKNHAFYLLTQNNAFPCVR